mgnify:CR=1 FL=1
METDHCWQWFQMVLSSPCPSLRHDQAHLLPDDRDAITDIADHRRLVRARDLDHEAVRAAQRQGRRGQRGAVPRSGRRRGALPGRPGPAPAAGSHRPAPAARGRPARGSRTPASRKPSPSTTSMRAASRGLTGRSAILPSASTYCAMSCCKSIDSPLVNAFVLKNIDVIAPHITRHQ